MKKRIEKSFIMVLFIMFHVHAFQTVKGEKKHKKNPIESITGISSTDAITSKDSDGRTSFHHAARKGNTAQVKRYLTNGWDVNMRDYYSNTPLLLCAGEGNVETMRVLVEAGADLLAKNVMNVNALTFALNNTKTEIVEFFLSYLQKQGKIQIIKQLLSNRDVYHYTPLHRAAKKGKTAIVKILLEHGADPYVWNGEIWQKGNSTSFHDAAFLGHTGVVDLLAPKLKSVNLLNAEGQSALHMAARSLSYDTAKLLVEKYKADRTLKDHYDHTPFDLIGKSDYFSQKKTLKAIKELQNLLRL